MIVGNFVYYQFIVDIANGFFGKNLRLIPNFFQICSVRCVLVVYKLNLQWIIPIMFAISKIKNNLDNTFDEEQ